MLEILLLRMLMGKIGEIVEGKGQKAGWYKALAVILWFVGEIAGFIFGAVVAGDDSFGLAYLFALMGAAAGAGLSFLIASQVKAAPTVDAQVFD
jgi:hypothetical protein